MNDVKTNNVMFEIPNAPVESNSVLPQIDGINGNATVGYVQSCDTGLYPTLYWYPPYTTYTITYPYPDQRVIELQDKVIKLLEENSKLKDQLIAKSRKR